MTQSERPSARSSVPAADLAGGAVARVGDSAVGLSRDEPFAVSRRCRHQLADLSGGSVDADGCLVCPWHGSRYDVRTGAMVSGPRGFLGYHGPTPGYAGLVRLLGRVLPLRIRHAVRRGDDVVVPD